MTFTPVETSPVTPPPELAQAGHRVVTEPPTVADPVPQGIREGEPNPEADKSQESAYNARDVFMTLNCTPCSYFEWWYLSDDPQARLQSFLQEHGDHQE